MQTTNSTNDNYTLRQLKLPLETEILIDISDLVYAFYDPLPYKRNSCSKTDYDAAFMVSLIGLLNKHFFTSKVKHRQNRHLPELAMLY